MLSESGSSDAQPQGALCALHPTAPAAAICTRCGSYACSKCVHVGADGLSYCSQCASKVTVLASRIERFGATLVDMLLLLVPTFGGFMLTLTVAKAFGSNTGGSVVMVLSAVGLLALLGYQLHGAVETGQTVGKRMLGIRLVRTDGNPVSLGRILLRNLIPIALEVLGLGLFTLFGLFSVVDGLFIFGKQRRCIHDWLADTKVVKVPPPERMG